MDISATILKKDILERKTFNIFLNKYLEETEETMTYLQ